MRDLLPYFADLIDILLAIDDEARVLRDPEVTARDHFCGDLSLTIAYADGSRLDVELQAGCSSEPIVWGDYAFQYTGPGGALRLRFDNAPHCHGLPNFPHHLHLATEAILPGWRR